MPTKLGIYNDALRAIGDLRLTSLTEDTEARYVLDDAWEGAVRFVFTEGFWNFASATEEITADPGQTPIPGFNYVFNKPANWLRTITVSDNSLFSDEALYRDENTKIYANTDTLYIRYISAARAVDDQVTNWPETFADTVGSYIAMLCAARLSGSKSNADALMKIYKETLASAKNKDAMDQAKVMFKPGSWVRSMRSVASNRDRGPLSGY
jgi:hypothetical protein